MTQFKVGDRVRRIRGLQDGQPIGYEEVIESIGPKTCRGDVWLHFPYGARGFSQSFELVRPAGPVVTEMVPKTRIVTGTYDHVRVVEIDPEGYVSIEIVDGNDCPRWMGADELDAAAAVLSALAKGLRDA